MTFIYFWQKHLVTCRTHNIDFYWFVDTWLSWHLKEYYQARVKRSSEAKAFNKLEEKRPIGRFLLALTEGLEHSSLLLTLSKNSVKK